MPVFAAPDNSQPPVASFKGGEDSTLEVVCPVDGEWGRPIVFSRKPGWLEVGLHGEKASYRDESVKRVWIEDQPARWPVRSVDGVDAERWLTAVWDPEANPGVTVLETRRVRGALWLRVQVLLGEACEISMSGEPSVALAEGWIPAHDRFGQLVVWFETYCD